MFQLAIAAANVNRVFAELTRGICGDATPREARGGGAWITTINVMQHLNVVGSASFSAGKSMEDRQLSVAVKTWS